MIFISKEIYLTFALITFFYYYNYPIELNFLLINIKTYINKFVIKYLNEDMVDYLLIGDGCSIIDSDSDSDFDSESESDESSEEIVKQEIKYEDKYLADIRKLNKEFVFDDEERKLEEKKKDEIYNTLINKYKEELKKLNLRLEEIETIFKNDIAECKRELLKEEIETGYATDVFEDVEVINAFNGDKKKELVEEYNTLIDELSHLYNVNEEEQQKEFKDTADSEAKRMIIDNKLNRLKDCFVMEKTPLGNVLMFYNHSRDAFEFYSDNTIPYRYLEAVARKYVKTFNCRPIFVDMEEELRLCEERIEKEEKEKEREKEKEKEREALKLLDNNLHQQIKPNEQKKSVFAKFKSYNKEAGTGRVNTCAPPKNSIPNKAVTEKESTEKILLKENANRYTYEGKLSNFNFLKKVERKMVDKKYAMSFADFKRQLICGNN